MFIGAVVKAIVVNSKRHEICILFKSTLSHPRPVGLVTTPLSVILVIVGLILADIGHLDNIHH